MTFKIHNSRVKDSRPSDKFGGSISRRREDKETGEKESTVEIRVKVLNELFKGRHTIAIAKIDNMSQVINEVKQILVKEGVEEKE